MKSTRYLRVLDNRNEIICERISEASDFNPCSNFSIRVVFSGFETYKIGNRTINLYPGNFLVINEGTAYTRSVTGATPVISFVINYDPAYLDAFVRSLRTRKHDGIFMPYRTAGDDDMVLIDSIYALQGDIEYNIAHLKTHADNGSADQFMIDQYLHHLLINYCGIYKEELHGDAREIDIIVKSRSRMDMIRRIAMAKDFIISNHEKNITLEDVSDAACLSVSHLIRIFRSVFNRSPYQYLIGVRLDRARYYLKHTDISVQEIVGLIGFESPSSFIRLFRSAYHMTPGTFRQANMPDALPAE